MSEMTSNELLPEFAGFFENARQGRLAFPCCGTCGKFHWYPMPRCPHCQGRDIAWRQISGRGELISFTSVMHPFDKSRANELPYVVALVKFTDAPGISFVTNIVGCKGNELQIGQSVEPLFRMGKGSGPIVEFRLA